MYMSELRKRISAGFGIRNPGNDEGGTPKLASLEGLVLEAVWDEQAG